MSKTVIIISLTDMVQAETGYSRLPEVRLNLGRTTGLEILQVTQGNIWKLKIKLSRLSSLNTKTKKILINAKRP